LPRAIDSVLVQTYAEIECIVVDDGSTDKTNELINSIEDDRLIYMRHESNKGASAARNTGIKHSKGSLIAFLDDDDEWLPTKLEKQVPFLQSKDEKVGMVYCWMDYFDENQQLIEEHHPILSGNVFPHLLDAQRLGGCPTLLVRREVIDNVGKFDENLRRGNDGDFIRRVCQQYHVDFLPEVLVRVHVDHGRNRISDENKESIEQVIQSLRVRFDRFPDEIKQFPVQAASICAYIASNYASIGETWKSIFWSFKAIARSPLNLEIYIRTFRLFRNHLSFSNRTIKHQ
jgi:glycosyltransferase involved in cell wall biosynthesis